MSDDDFKLRVGRIRSKGVGGARTFVGVALAAVVRAGGQHLRRPHPSGAFGRGRPASLYSQRTLGPRSRGAVVKARVVRHLGGRGRLGTHLSYLQREGVTHDGERGRMFDAGGDEADGRAFASRCEPDRHHFRFIVSPDDAEQLADLKAYTRDLMRHAEHDLGTSLDWVAVDHWNTAHPHVHVLVRGKSEDGRDLVISRDYIREGLRARAGQLVTLELGLRSDAELQRRLDQQVTSERWTPLDRGMAVGTTEADGLLDLRPPSTGRPDPLQRARLARLRKLESLGFAEEVRPGRWRLAVDAEPTLRALGRRGDIIARLHRAMTQQGLERDPAAFVMDPDEAPPRVVGRLVGRGLDDELRGSGYAIVDGLDGCAHHVPVRDLDDAADAPLGAIVEAQGDGRGSARLWVRSDLSVDEQVRADGATWLDRQLVGRTPEAMAQSGFGEEVRRALEARAEHLAEAGLARRSGQRVVFAGDLLETLRARELQTTAGRIADELGRPHQPVGPDGTVSGGYRQRLDLASGRFAVIDNGLGFTLVPWRPELERHLGKLVNGVWLPGQGMTWSFSPKRGLGR